MLVHHSSFYFRCILFLAPIVETTYTMARNKASKVTKKVVRTSSKSRGTPAKTVTTTQVTQRQPRKKNPRPQPRANLMERALSGGADAYYRRQFDAMSKFLYGFCDPDNAGRGPPHDNVPTTVASYRSTMDITLTPYNGTWSPYLATTTGPPATASPYMMNAMGDIAIVVCPSVDNTNNSVGGRPAGCMATGYTLDPDNMSLSTTGWGASGGGYAKPYPLPPFPEAVPALNTGISPSDNINTAPVPFRCLGLRSTLMCTSSPMVAMGDVYAGDNRDYYADEAVTELRVDSGGSAVRQFDVDVTENFQLNSPLVTFGRSVGPVGPVAQGIEYESVFLPGNSQALQYHAADNAGMQVFGYNGTSLNNAKFIAFDLLNYPCNIFILKGLNTTTPLSFKLSVVFTVEMPCTTNSSLALFYREARLASSFAPDWGLLSCMNAGGKAGQVAECMAMCGSGSRGVQFALTGQASPATIAPKSTGQGPESSTAVALRESPAESHPGLVHRALSFGAAHAASAALAYQNRGHIARIARGLRDKVGMRLLRWGRAAEGAVVAAEPYAIEAAEIGASAAF